MQTPQGNLIAIFGEGRGEGYIKKEKESRIKTKDNTKFKKLLFIKKRFLKIKVVTQTS